MCINLKKCPQFLIGYQLFYGTFPYNCYWLVPWKLVKKDHKILFNNINKGMKINK